MLNDIHFCAGDPLAWLALRDEMEETGSEQWPGITCPVTGMKFSLLPMGEFFMGGHGAPNEKPVHCVRLSKPFYVGIHPVTQSQWYSVMLRRPSQFPGDDNPVETVSWYDCQEFCTKLTKLTGKPVRLPTEAQWEYACRAGSTTDFALGDGKEVMTQMGWCFSNSERRTQPVKQKKPNKWGLFDMHGNVWEWCRDYFKHSYVSHGSHNPSGPTGGTARMLRGGSWDLVELYSQSSYRNWHIPDQRNNRCGLRVVFRANIRDNAVTTRRKSTR